MRKKLRNNILPLLALLIMITLGACRDNEQEQAAGSTAYTCPMHSQIVQTEPGSCPVCGMDLVAKAAQGNGITVTEDLAFLIRPTNTSVVASIATVSPIKKNGQASIKMDGIITYDPRRVYAVPARVSGRIEKLFVKYNFQPVRKGQKLMEVYSPDLITAQKELLYLVKSAPEDKNLIAAARQKLQYLGATSEQINRLLRKGEETYTFALYSPYNGYVIDLNTSAPASTASMAAAPIASAGTMDAMGSSSATTTPTSVPTTATGQQGIQLREGMYLNAGQQLLRVINTAQLWAEFNASASEITALITKGTPLQITFPQLPEETLAAKIDFVQPYFDEGQNFAKVRAYIPGSQKLAMIGQLVTAEATYSTAPALWVPKAAVLDIGNKSVAFKKIKGVFEPVAVSTGIVSGNMIELVTGLQQADTIAANAQFLIDSESFIKVKN
ncbi:efflux RND transporter periplasmic adaptor subunit [Pontibacter arcticus]|uniref:RND transporter n=1 Tax=Pontibacter arcticus TaxID=2080288 RepID=A0A364RHF8_9BACT|nr:efflux RND transporter periplasmic adaptor subunit [Pontibacter arcticus]RAU83739.1 RND transporter [Pontibacter arcticus]